MVRGAVHTLVAVNELIQRLLFLLCNFAKKRAAMKRICSSGMGAQRARLENICASRSVSLTVMNALGNVCNLLMSPFATTEYTKAGPGGGVILS